MSDECRPVLILEDSRLEGNESFAMNLATTSSVADLDPTISTVTIIDNDGEYTLHVFLLVQHLLLNSYRGEGWICRGKL